MRLHGAPIRLSRDADHLETPTPACISPG
jgi:hypothetical protein